MRKYIASSRNGYTVIDEYRPATDGSDRLVYYRTLSIDVKTGKQGAQIEQALNEAYTAGLDDELARR